MRLDTECDLTIEAANAAERVGITRLRNQLLAEHLDMSAEAVDAALGKDASLVRLIDSRTTQARCLRELPAENEAPELLDDALVDPSRPLTADFVIEALASSVAPAAMKRAFPFVFVSVAFVFFFFFLFFFRIQAASAAAAC